MTNTKKTKLYPHNLALTPWLRAQRKRVLARKLIEPETSVARSLRRMRPDVYDLPIAADGARDAFEIEFYAKVKAAQVSIHVSPAVASMLFDRPMPNGARIDLHLPGRVVFALLEMDVAGNGESLESGVALARRVLEEEAVRVARLKGPRGSRGRVSKTQAAERAVSALLVWSIPRIMPHADRAEAQRAA